MRERKISFIELPVSLRYGLSLVVFSWFFFLVSHSVYTGKISLIHITMGMFICFAVFSLKNWGRILTVVYDTFMAVMLGVELYYLIQSGVIASLTPFVIKGLSIILFIVSSLFLLMTEARAFYNNYNRQ